MKKRYIILIILLFLIVAINIFLFSLNKKLSNYIDPNTYVDNINISGISISELDEKLEELENKKLQTKIVFKQEDITKEYTYTDLNTKLNSEEIKNKIKTYYATNLINRIQTYLKEKDLKKEFYLKPTFDKDTIYNIVLENFKDKETKGNIEYALQDTSIELKVTKSKEIDFEQIYTDLESGEKDIYILLKDKTPKIEEDKIINYLEKNKDKVEQKGKNASLAFVGNELTVVDGYNGKTLNKEKTIKNIETYLRKNETLIPLAFDETPPSIKAEDLRKKINNIKTKIGSCTTSFTSSTSGRSTNIEIAAKKFDGIVLAPNETLSFYNVVGSITQSKGYKIATVFSGGKAVDGIGGGVCQVATTLYNAALYANLEIVERHNHGLPVGYVKPSLDATVSGKSLDLKIKNTSGGYIYIRSSIKDKQLTFDIYGEEKKYDVELTSNILNYIEPGENKVLNTNLESGTQKTISNGKKGYKSEGYRIVKQNGKIIKKEKLSTDTYNATNKEIQYN